MDIKVEFKKSEIIISIVLCFMGLAFFTYLLFFNDTMPKAIAIFLILVTLHILIFVRFRQLQLCIKQKTALSINEKGLTNYTRLTTKIITWDEIIDFRSGYFRSNSVYINPKNVKLYKTSKVKDYVSFINYINDFFTAKPDCLWLDTDMMNIKKQDLISLLNKYKMIKNEL